MKAAAYFFFRDYVFGEVIIINFVCQFMWRAGIYAMYSTCMASPKRKIQIEDEGVYGAFTYAWRSLFLSFDFQSYSKTVFCWFYVENLLMLLTPYVWAYGTPFVGRVGAENLLEGRLLFHVYVGAGVVKTILAICIKLGIRYRCRHQKQQIC